MESIKVNPMSKEDLPQKRKLPAKGSFTRPEVPDHENHGIGSKAPENKNMTPHVDAAKKIEDIKKSEQEKKALAKKREEEDNFVIAAEKVLSAHKFKKLMYIMREPDDLQELLGIKFDDTDLDKIIFKGEISKEIDVLKNGKYMAVFKTLNRKERNDIEKMVARAVKDGNDMMTTIESKDAFKNERLLAYSVQSVNGESIGTTIEEKIQYLGTQNEWVYQYLINTFNMFTFAVGELLDADKLKNS